MFGYFTLIAQGSADIPNPKLGIYVIDVGRVTRYFLLFF